MAEANEASRTQEPAVKSSAPSPLFISNTGYESPERTARIKALNSMLVDYSHHSARKTASEKKESGAIESLREVVGGLSRFIGVIEQSQSKMAGRVNRRASE